MYIHTYILFDHTSRLRIPSVATVQNTCSTVSQYWSLYRFEIFWQNVQPKTTEPRNTTTVVFVNMDET